MKEVRAADPNVTFLDDGNITYKDLEHGAFELVTKEVIPRYFLVEDPGQTIVLRSQGFLGQRQSEHEFPCANGRIAGGPAGSALDL